MDMNKALCSACGKKGFAWARPLCMYCGAKHPEGDSSAMQSKRKVLDGLEKEAEKGYDQARKRRIKGAPDPFPPPL